MRRQARRESSRAWIASGAAVTIKTYARRYGVDRYTAYEDLTAIGFPLPDSAQRSGRLRSHAGTCEARTSIRDPVGHC